MDAPRPSAAMEGKGAYNRHSLIPSAGGALALPQCALSKLRLRPAIGGRFHDTEAMMRGDMDSARAAAEIFLAAAERTASPPTIAAVHRSLGATLVVRGDLAGAVRQLQEAIELTDREPFADPGTGVTPEAGTSAPVATCWRESPRKLAC
jgi:hypothetical protein